MIKCENACPRGKFDGCCHKCPDFHTCPDSCQEDPNTCGSSTFDEEAEYPTEPFPPYISLFLISK